jgi:AraC-like ligand binding domain
LINRWVQANPPSTQGVIEAWLNTMAWEPKKDRAKLWREPSFGGIDLLRAHFERHCFARHAHDEFVIAIFEQGAEQFEANGSAQVAEAGSVLVIPPGVPHTGSAATPAGWTYRAFYPRPEVILDLRAQLFRRSCGHVLSLPVHQLRDAELGTALIAAHKAFEARAPLLECDSRMLSAFSFLLSHLETMGALPPGREARAIKRVREHL